MGAKSVPRNPGVRISQTLQFYIFDLLVDVLLSILILLSQNTPPSFSITWLISLLTLLNTLNSLSHFPLSNSTCTLANVDWLLNDANTGTGLPQCHGRPDKQSPVFAHPPPTESCLVIHFSGLPQCHGRPEK